MASTRVRKAFKYPSDEEDEPDDLDEEHQEKLISELQTQDAQRNELYRKLFIAIPLIAALFFIYTFLFNSASAQKRLLSLLALTSLVCTAYILHFQPLEAPQRKGKIPMYQLDAAKGPIEKYLAHLNAGLAGLLLLAAGLDWSRGAQENAFREALPMIIFGLTMFVRQQLAPLDLEELQKAKYDYKGA